MTEQRLIAPVRPALLSSLLCQYSNMFQVMDVFSIYSSEVSVLAVLLFSTTVRKKNRKQSNSNKDRWSTFWGKYVFVDKWHDSHPLFDRTGQTALSLGGSSASPLHWGRFWPAYFHRLRLFSFTFSFLYMMHEFWGNCQSWYHSHTPLLPFLFARCSKTLSPPVFWIHAPHISTHIHRESSLTGHFTTIWHIWAQRTDAKYRATWAEY